MFKEIKDLKALRMELALVLHQEARTDRIYEILDDALERAAQLGWVRHCDKVCSLETGKVERCDETPEEDRSKK